MGLKFIKMWTCSQCGDPLGKKCRKCLKHPDRKPVVVEWFHFPKIVRHCECAKSVLIPCQRDGCANTRWVNNTNTRGRLYRYETVYCSRRCNLLVQNAKRKTAVTVPCGWHECGKPVLRKRSELKNFKTAFCRRDHYFMAMRKEEYDKKHADRAHEEDQAFACVSSRCRGAVTDHKRTETALYACTRCHFRVKEPPPRLLAASTAS